MRFCFRVARVAIGSIVLCIETLLASLPNGPFYLLRVWWWQRKGYAIGKRTVIHRNVYFLGSVTVGNGTSISNNCFLNGCEAGIRIGDKVMIAPNCVLVAFDHDYRDLSIPMIDQPWINAPIEIEDDVWIGANCTITKGVRLGRGSIVGANSVVTKDVEPYAIVGGVPARVLGTRDPNGQRMAG